MKNLVHNDEKIIRYDDSITGEYTFVLENKTKLSEVFKFLPHGIVNKTETGIGATTLELQAERSSIIVEPIKVTASLKAEKRTKYLRDNPDQVFANPGALYVGSETIIHKKTPTRKEIIDYHKSVGFKKLVVVADSLERVLKAIGEDAFKEYFLMIDEADAFQLDSTYRNSMNICLDYFKKFPEENRALVTATMLEFSDPEVANIAKTVIQD